ncbi:MAG: Glycosyltransferase family 2 protein [Magnetococcales bacterium]|nr:Glycosyltransferase family 2 protein [Magnetococcales bacterium]HIJ84431.1 glycosyltransferase family 2 protein [Magnetococcales bacterium]
MNRVPLSVVLITRNAGTVLEPCLESVDFADEIVLIDSGSEDNTLEIAWKHNARTLYQPWLGYGPQKHFAVSQAAHDWVLCLDADERVSDQLRASILETLKNPGYKAYRFPRRNRFLGRWLAHGEGYPDLSLRLFQRNFASWSEDPIHEKVHTKEPIGQLSGDLYHESEQSLADYLTKQNLYTSLQAEQIHQSGRPFHASRILLSPLVRFIRFYFFRLGFLDGLPGLIHISLGTFNSFLKYAKVYAKRVNRRD